MGGGTFDTNSYRSFTKSVAHKPVDEVFSSRGIHKDLNPKGVKVRESRDSADSPNSTPIVVAVDVTGSMGFIADYFAREGLGTLFEGILQRKPVTDPHLMFMGFGDAACDQAPLQVSQFEADNRIVAQLTNLWLEKGGGGNNHESDDAAWYFAGRHTAHDSMAKRGKRGYLFTVGDEQAPTILTKAQLGRFMGTTPEADVSSIVSLEEARRLYDVFHVIVEEGDYASRAITNVRASWAELLGQRVISLPNHKLLSETIVSAIQVAEGADVAKAVSGWDNAAGQIIGRAVANLPRGVPAPRMLGRAR